jgi:hypothetical protein
VAKRGTNLSFLNFFQVDRTSRPNFVDENPLGRLANAIARAFGL